MTTLAEYVEVNPSAHSIDRTSRDLVAFVPMAAVSEEGTVANPQARPLADVAKGYTYFERNDVLMAKITPCMENGKAALFDSNQYRRGFGSTEFHVLRPKPGVDPRFVFYLVWNKRFRDEAAKHMTGTAGQKRVPVKYLTSAPVPTIEPTCQRRIADILDKAYGVRRKHKECIALWEELTRSAFFEMFGDPVTNPRGWDVKPLGDVAEAASGVTKGKRYDQQALVILPYMRVANVQDGHLNLDEVKTISVSEEEGQRYKLQNGDVLLTEGGDPDKLGRGTVWHDEIPDCIHQNHIFRVRPGPLVRSEYLSAIIGSARGKRYFLRAAKQTTGIATINMTQLKAFPVLVPPRDLQDNYVDFIGRASRRHRTVQKRQALLDDLFDSLVARAFSDRLVGMEPSC